MARKKVTLAFIQKDVERRASFRKRKNGLMKKVEELSTLCGVEAFLIIYSAYHDEPLVWPPSPDSFQRALSKFKLFPEMLKFKKMVNQEGLAMQRIHKMQEQIKKQQNDNREMELTDLMYKCLDGEKIQNFSVNDLTEMQLIINRNLFDVSQRMAFFKSHIPPQGPQPAPPVNLPMAHDQMSMNQMQNLSWDMDLQRICNEQPRLVSYVWPDPFLPSIPNNNGAGPSHSSIP